MNFRTAASSGFLHEETKPANPNFGLFPGSKQFFHGKSNQHWRFHSVYKPGPSEYSDQGSTRCSCLVAIWIKSDQTYVLDATNLSKVCIMSPHIHHQCRCFQKRAAMIDGMHHGLKAARMLFAYIEGTAESLSKLTPVLSLDVLLYYNSSFLQWLGDPSATL